MQRISKKPSTAPAAGRLEVGPAASTWRLALGLFLCFLAFYLATASGHEITIDGEYYFRAAESLALRHSFAVQPVSPDDLGKFALRAPDGQTFGKFAPLQSIAEAPFYLLARPLLTLVLSGQALAGALRVWVPVATTAVIGAGLVALTAIAVLALGYSRRIALAVALILGLGTLVWPYGRSEFSEPLQALLLLGAFLAIRRVRPSGIGSDALVAGLLLGLLVLAKAINVLVLPVFGLALLWRLRHARPRAMLTQLLSFGLAALIGVGAFCLLNVSRTGSPLNFGYKEPFDTPLLLGLYGWMASPGKGVFLYMPVLIAAVVALPAFARRHGFETAVVVAASALLVIFYARFWAWSGDWAWGTRFALPLLPLWILPIATAIATWRVPGRTLLGVAVAASVAIQVIGVAVDPMKYLAYYHGQISPLYGEPAGYTWEKESTSQVHFAPELSPILEQGRVLLATLDAAPGRTRRPPEGLVEPPPLSRALGVERWLPTPSGQLLGFDPWPLRSSLGQGGWIALACLGAVCALGVTLLGAELTGQGRTRR